MTDVLHKLRTMLGGDIVGGQLLCAGPGHSIHDRSLAVRPSGGRLIVHSFSGDDWRDCLAYVRERLGQPQWHPDRHLDIDLDIDIEDLDINLDHRHPYRRDPTASKSRSLPSRKDGDRIKYAQRIWSEARDPRGTAAERYLNARKLSLPPELCGSVLRFHPHCPWNGKKVPCLIAAYCAIDTEVLVVYQVSGAERADQITAIHRVRLDQPERWPKADRKMLGAVAGSAIKLDALGDCLAIGEGLETCLAARQMRLFSRHCPVWALGSVSGIKSFRPLDGVDHLLILGEHDGGASLAAAKSCQKLWRNVSFVLPVTGDDFNAALMEPCNARL